MVRLDEDVGEAARLVARFLIVGRLNCHVIKTDLVANRLLGLIQRHLARKAHLMRIGDYLLADIRRLQHLLTHHLLAAQENSVRNEQASAQGGEALIIVAALRLLESREN